MKPDRVLYGGWEIITLRIPTTDGRWLASYCIEQGGRPCVPALAGSSIPFIFDDQDEAYGAACCEAKRQIDRLASGPALCR